MKKELLALHDYNIKISSAVSLCNISLVLMEGECSAFLGLISSGKSELVKVISGDEWSAKEQIVLDNSLVLSPDDIKDKIHKIAEINYAISDWTVAEYIGLVSKSKVPWIFECNRLLKEIETLFDALDIPIDINRKLKHLSEVEKRLVDLVKAFRKNSKILIIEDEFSGLTNEELRRFKRSMDRIIKGRMTVVINVNANNVNRILADNYVILKKGHIIKKCRKDKIESTNQLERVLLETSTDLSIERSYIDSLKSADKNQIIYSVNNLIINKNKTIDLDFKKGKVTSLLTLNKSEKERIFNVLSGRQIDKNIKVMIDGNQVVLNNIADYVENKIVSINQLGVWDELLGKMSIGENVLLPSLNKFSMLDYLKNGNQMSIMLRKQLTESKMEYNVDADSKKLLQSIFITMERWYVFSPRVVVMLEPFYQCDIYGSSIIKSYINKFKKNGASIIIVKSRKSDIEDISDEIIKI